MTNPGDPITPTIKPDRGAPQPYYGLTKREWFTGLAMQGILARINADLTEEIIAERSTRQADALIAELNKIP